ncbi:MAG: right-handed parallel beta-helix repeat-containing protein [Pseudomonadota bacterium]
MRRFWIAMLAALTGMGGTAAGETIYAAQLHAEPAFARDTERCGEGPGDGLIGYLGQEPRCADITVGNLRQTEGLEAGEIREIVLLTSRPATRTLYRVGEAREPILAIGDLVRPVDRPLVIRGQKGPDGGHLVWFRGLDLIDTICDPARVLDEEACRNGQPVAEEEDREGASWERHYDLGSLVLVEEARNARLIRQRLAAYPGVTIKGARHYCVLLRRVSGLILSDLGFEDCWLSAVAAINSRRIALRGARIHGSTAGFLAAATGGLSADAHSFVVADTHWIQSPGGYRSDKKPCANPHRDLRCAVDVWDDLPWGVAHHHLWRPLNGGLFVSYDIAGNVLFERNVLERAFNGIRMTSRRPRTGRNVTVQGNRFRMIRDNAVEPEQRAENWVIKHNVFENNHAWLSTDGVSGRGFYIFGNRAFYDPEAMPGTRCRDDVAWVDSPFLMGLAGDEGRYQRLNVSHDPSAVTCKGHYRGAILKTGDKRKAGFPYLDSIAIFHNSWQSRSPLWGNKHASPLVHANNLIEFAGCGLDGPWHCRQIPTPERYCQEGNKRTRGRVALKQYWTEDARALVADCVSLLPGPAQPDERALETREIAHHFCRDLYNRSFGAIPYRDGLCAPLFDAAGMIVGPAMPPRLAEPVAGCSLGSQEDRLTVDFSRFGAQIGAVQPGGYLFDMEIPGAGYLGEAFRP